MRPVNIQLPGAPSPAGFEQPFEMLHACHDRVGRMLDLLNRLRQHLVSQGADDQVRQAARDVMRYFDMAAPEHHRDEELHVFPPLIAQGDAPTQAIVARLRQDHLQMESQWGAVREILAALASGHHGGLSAAEEAMIEEFAGLYAGHIEAEEQIAYPAAHALLSPQSMHAMTRDMMARRGLLLD